VRSIPLVRRWNNSYTKYPLKYLEELRRDEKEARENKKGLWRR
jgi:endonuclease YncB( thermonuclease family)